MIRMTQILRRYLLILALALWLGGFTFYASFVLPAAHDVIGDDFQNGLVTRSVTTWLNRIGVVAIGLMLWDALASCRPGYRRYTALALVACLAATISHVGLFAVHPRLDAMIDVNGEQIADPASFLYLHRTYKQISSVQWVAGMTFLCVSLLNWRWIDSRTVDRKPCD